MLQTEPLAILAQYDRWATERLIEACRGLDARDLDREFPIGPGSLRRALVHVVANMEWWSDRAQGRAVRAFAGMSADAPPSLDAIQRRFDDAWADLGAFIARSDAAGLAEVIESDFEAPDMPGGVVTARFPRAGVLLHIFNHGTHHRAQCLNMLRQLGVSPLPEIDLIDSNQELVTPPG